MLVLSAPKAGTINRVTVNPGQWLAVGTVVAELIDTRQMLVQVGVPPTEAKRVLPKQKAFIALRGESPQKPAMHAASEGEEGEGDALEKEAAEKPSYRDAFTGPDVLTGEVMFVGNETQAANGLVPVNIRVEDGKASLRLGAVASRHCDRDREKRARGAGIGRGAVGGGTRGDGGAKWKDGVHFGGGRGAARRPHAGHLREAAQRRSGSHAGSL